MKPVRFTDAERYRVPYVPAAATNIRATFEYIERERVQKNRRRAPGHRGAVTEENAR